ncbi:uncharacterized protein EI90DRAFT_3286952 [Cantharellus anzutake]|uniref:uncharacterized protein n=1 Tax=Cantharellus anzutake TaxID=1750568 RepID=UPI001903648D|nr:uncharacterized protein EI90DRAFT_3286952 [Cantharellus anzutake]KAF8338294.1 hypothetical protein EI90DRAFT_3286952 [Cantharellus anzutake]
MNQQRDSITKLMQYAREHNIQLRQVERRVNVNDTLYACSTNTSRQHASDDAAFLTLEILRAEQRFSDILPITVTLPPSSHEETYRQLASLGFRECSAITTLGPKRSSLIRLICNSGFEFRRGSPFIAVSGLPPALREATPLFGLLFLTYCGTGLAGAPIVANKNAFRTIKVALGRVPFLTFLIPLVPLCIIMPDHIKLLQNKSEREKFVLEWDDNEIFGFNNSTTWQSTVIINGVPVATGDGARKAYARDKAAKEKGLLVGLGIPDIGSVVVSDPAMTSLIADRIMMWTTSRRINLPVKACFSRLIDQLNSTLPVP